MMRPWTETHPARATDTPDVQCRVQARDPRRVRGCGRGRHQGRHPAAEGDTSHISEWRRARDAGALAGLAPRPRPRAQTPERRELARQQRRAEKAEAELAKARLVIDIQGKASELLGRLLAESDEDEKQSR